MEPKGTPSREQAVVLALRFATDLAAADTSAPPEIATDTVPTMSPAAKRCRRSLASWPPEQKIITKS